MRSFDKSRKLMILSHNPNFKCIFEFSYQYLCTVSQQIKIFHLQLNFFTELNKLFQQKCMRCLTFDAVYSK